LNLSALKSGNFRKYLIGNVFALHALWMGRVTIGWLAWDMTSQAGFVGLVAFAGFAPTIFLGPFFGVMADRVSVKAAALFTQSALVLVALSLFGSHVTGLLGPSLLLALSSVHGVISAMHNPVRLSLAPRLVAREDVASVVNIVGINFNLARLLGPALGGLSIASLGISASLLIQSLLYLPFLLALSRLEIRPRRQLAPADTPGFFSALNEGVSYVRQSRLVLSAFLVSGIMALAIRGTLEILPVLADGVFQRGASGLGLMTSAAGLGALLAGLAKALAPPQSVGQLPITGILSSVVGAVLVPLLGISTNWTLALSLIALLGFATTLTAVSMQTAIQQDLDDDMRGRVMSFWVMIAIGGTAIGAGILGIAVDVFGLTAALNVAGGSSALLLGLILLRRCSLPRRVGGTGG